MQRQNGVILIAQNSGRYPSELVNGIREHFLRIEASHADNSPDQVGELTKTNAPLHIAFIANTPDQDLIYLDVVARPPSSNAPIFVADIPDGDPIKTTLEKGDLDRYRQDMDISPIDGRRDCAVLVAGDLAAMAALRRPSPLSVDINVENDLPLKIQETLQDHLIPPYLPFFSRGDGLYSLRENRSYNLPWERKKGRKRKKR